MFRLESNIEFDIKLIKYEMNKKHYLRILIAWLMVVPAVGSNIGDLYKKADSYYWDYTNKYYNYVSNANTVGEGAKFVYQTWTKRGKEFMLVDADMKTQGEAFDHMRLADSLSALLNRETKPFGLPLENIRFDKELATLYYNIGDREHAVDLNTYSISQSHKPNRGSYWGGVYKENSKDRVASPDGKKEAYISEGNLWVREKESGKAVKLSYDGSPYEYYSSNIYWSPDSRKIVSCKYYPVENRKLLLISSSPKDQLQSKTEEYDYPKPGDALPVRIPVAFDVESGEIIRFDVPNVDEQYDLSRIRWNGDSDFFTFEFNRRGHQQYFVYAGDIASKSLRTIVKEKSSTFIYYNALYRHWNEKRDELLWISERDGWRHLYLYDYKGGKKVRQLTKGEWIVKSVVNVDEDKRTVLFVGCGVDKGVDPYLEKYYLLNMDSGKIVCLTPEDANHKATFSDDYKYMLDSYSRVDMPHVVVMRSLEDAGRVIYKPELQPDISEVVAKGWTMPEVFSAKGRDGVTDIWGMIVRPANFDSSKSYPVIEYIYAGPHDSHVPKSFWVEHTFSALAEMGFITVMIDGMGTANRSKAFHDVCWQNLKDAGLPDHISWLKAAADKYPEMDISNVGIYGVSAGGQSTMGALLFHPEFYKVGVSSCACHDNRMDKIWWNEQWMGYPVGKHYEESSNMVNAHLLEGELMLILGELDNNVDPASTLQVVDKLIENDKEFEFVMLPGARHTLGEKYGERKRRDFFVKHILKLDAPIWNAKDR